MLRSQNGWPIVGKSACDQGPFHGVVFPNGILAGDVATIARWQLARYAAEVEPLRAGSCWGWFVKPIEGSGVPSNHGSATAWDINADRHPMGVPAAENMNSAQIAACRKIIKDAGGVLRWGGDYAGRPDPMHWEIVGNAAAVAALAKRLRQPRKDDMLPHEGDEGETVKYWQFVLQKLGYDVGKVDGVYGKKTAAAVNADRAKRGEGPHTEITGWHALQMQIAVGAL